MALLSPELTSQHIVKLTQKLLDAIVASDWNTYQTLCDSTITAFEPEARGTLIEGLGFHKFFFDIHSLQKDLSTDIVKVTINNPRVRLVGGTNACAIIAYIRLVQTFSSKNKDITISKSEETRVWEKRGVEWKHVHFHRSKLGTSKL